MSWYLIDVLTEGSVATETNGTGATLPRAIRGTVTVHSTETWVRKAAICPKKKHGNTFK